MCAIDCMGFGAYTLNSTQQINMADSKMPKNKPGVASEHPGKQVAYREEAEKREKLGHEFLEEISELGARDIETLSTELHALFPFLLHEAKNRLARRATKKEAHSSGALPLAKYGSEFELLEQGALSFRDRVLAIFELMGGPSSWRYHGRFRFPTNEIKLTPQGLKSDSATAESDTQVPEGKGMSNKDGFEPVVPVTVWKKIFAAFFGACLLFGASEAYWGPQHVSALVIVSLAFAFGTMEALAIYSWWHWVNSK